MNPTRLGTIREAISGTLLSGSDDTVVSGISIDSRSMGKGDLFFALKGTQSDGHGYVEAALAAGASGAVISHALPPVSSGCLVLVPDPLKALQQWAAAYRAQFELMVVGITGSTGKTTTKDMVKGVLSRRWNTLATAGNFNNEIGLPLTLLNLDFTHEALAVEMGMRGPGEIAFLCSLAKPGMGLITNIGPTHIERLGSVDNIAAAKGELLAGLAPHGWAVLNYDDPYCRKLGQACGCRVQYYGFGQEADIRAADVEITDRGYSFTAFLEGKPVPVSLPFWGRHLVYNALAAMALGFYLGMDPSVMAEALYEVRLSGMRLEPVPGIKGSLLLNDSYNANPISTKAALEVLAERRTGRAVAVLGDMLELGEYGPSAHRQVGETAAALNLDLLVTVGSLAAETVSGALAGGMPRDRVFPFATPVEAAVFLKGRLREGDLVLVKASRGLRLESLVAELRGAQ